MTIKDLRTINNYSQKELANVLGVTQQAVQKWEKKDTKIGRSVEEKIHKLFGYGKKNGRITSYDIGSRE